MNNAVQLSINLRQAEPGLARIQHDLHENSIVCDSEFLEESFNQIKQNLFKVIDLMNKIINIKIDHLEGSDLEQSRVQRIANLIQRNLLDARLLFQETAFTESPAYLNTRLDNLHESFDELSNIYMYYMDENHISFENLGLGNIHELPDFLTDLKGDNCLTQAKLKLLDSLESFLIKDQEANDFDFEIYFPKFVALSKSLDINSTMIFYDLEELNSRKNKEETELNSKDYPYLSDFVNSLKASNPNLSSNLIMKAISDDDSYEYLIEQTLDQNRQEIKAGAELRLSSLAKDLLQLHRLRMLDFNQSHPNHFDIDEDIYLKHKLVEFETSKPDEVFEDLFNAATTYLIDIEYYPRSNTSLHPSGLLELPKSLLLISDGESQLTQKQLIKEFKERPVKKPELERLYKEHMRIFIEAKIELEELKKLYDTDNNKVLKRMISSIAQATRNSNALLTHKAGKLIYMMAMAFGQSDEL